MRRVGDGRLASLLLKSAISISGMNKIEASRSRSRRAPSPVLVSQDAAPSHVSRRNAQRRLIAFGWYGGKYSHLDWLLPLLPECLHYCEPFAGSAAALLNRDPSPVETYNDLDGEVVNFFRVLRDNPEEVAKQIALTPFSREEYFIAVTPTDEMLTPIERARRFYVRARQTRTGLAQKASLGRWANCKNTSRSGMSGVISRWLGGITALDEIAQRLVRVQIENRPAVEIIRLYDSKDTLFYCDPPYLHATRGDDSAYCFEMDDLAHRELADCLNSIHGKAAVSGYDHPLMAEFFPPERWRRHQAPPKMIHSTKGIRQELLWTNYDINARPGLFK
jgi:DNA adenine methylase